MLSAVKSLIRQPIVNRLNKRYKKRLDSGYVSYDSWIRQKEAGYLAGVSDNTENIQVIEYSEVGRVTPASDVVLFTADKNRLSKEALRVVASVFNNHTEAMVVYGDEDEYNSNKTIRMNPTFRPDFSPDTLKSYFYMGNVVAFRKEVLPEKATDIYELTVKAVEKLTAIEVRHVDYVLYHNDYTKALYLGDNRFAPVLPENIKEGELISIIIPSKDNPEVLKNLLNSIWNLTTGVIYEVIVIDNGSNEENQIKIKQIAGEFRYIYEPQEFNFSRICNRGAGLAKGDYVLFLNDDMEVRDGSWLYQMLMYARQNHVGAVGAKLYYPKSRMIQHCGITNLRLGPVHKLQYKQDDRVYYDHINDVNRNVLGVTGACLLMKKKLFDKVGGFDENLKVAFNDVDLCYTLYEEGYHNVIVNTTYLWHYESLSRGEDESREKLERLAGERTRLYEKHPKLYGKDPYYHDYLTNDILDSNFTCAYEYEYDDCRPDKISHPRPKKISYKLKPHWENECLIISLEQCGTLKYWMGPNATEINDNDIYIGGYAFVAGSDNSCFDFKLLLKGDAGIYEIPCNHLYRPDLEINLALEENAVMCGFSIRPDLDELPYGEYQVGVIARGLASRLVLCRFTNRYINNCPKE